MKQAIVFECVYRQWVGKPDPSGFGRYTYKCSPVDEQFFLERVKKQQDQILSRTFVED
jgi:hypothetical protein